MSTRTLATPNVRFTAIEEGAGPLVLCLHGFPDDASSFRHLMPVLAAAGFRVVAPYMRGYAPTSTATDRRYDGMALGEDVVALLDALGAERAIVVGHDWGAAAAYFGSLLAPQRLTKLVGMAVPYGPQFFRALVASPAQIRRSWYMFFFQHGLAEEALSRDDFALVDRLVAEWSPGWRPTAEERAARNACLGAPGTLEAALGYYRQTMGPVFADPSIVEASAQAFSVPLPMPALMIHGADDGCIGAELVPPMREYFPAGLRIEIVPGAGHFVHRERPDVVSRLVLDFLRA